jgi:hypothetical protein
MIYYFLFGFLLTKIVLNYLKHDPYYCQQNNTLYDKPSDSNHEGDDSNNHKYIDVPPEENHTDPAANPTSNVWSIRPKHGSDANRGMSGYDERFPLWNLYGWEMDEERIMKYMKQKALLEKLERGKYSKDDKEIKDLFDEIENNDIRGFRLFVRPENQWEDEGLF